jgi:predicted acylesterase/phospholipase RssA
VVRPNAAQRFDQIERKYWPLSELAVINLNAQSRGGDLMSKPLLAGIRVLLSGSIPDGTPSESQISRFVTTFARRVLQEGGTLVHGSHPSFVQPLRAAAVPFVRADGARDALVFVRARKYSMDPEQLREIESQREFASVEIIPSLPEDATTSLVPMREWLADRSDVVVAVGGRWYDVSKARAGVPRELEGVLKLGKPGFVIAGYGGATAGYLADDGGLLERLHNGLSAEENRDLAQLTDPDAITNRIIAQIRLLPLIHGNTSSGRRFRILALDGGGLRGAFTAAVLATWAEMLGENGGADLIKHFDLVAGTSTGAILAIGLGIGLTPLEILNFYREEGPTIFPSGGKVRHWLRSKHDATTLRDTLKKILQDRVLSEHSCCRLVIPTVRATHGVAEVITTAHASDRVAFKKCSAVDAALASSAAPTYFDDAEIRAEIANQRYLDGGIWANNPVLPAIAEAVAFLGVPLDRIDVLSVGTLASEVDLSNALRKGIAAWGPEVSGLFFAAQESAAAALADALLTKARHLRVNQQTPEPIPLDNTAALEKMIERGNNVGRDYFSAVRSRFLDGRVVADWREARNG